MFILRMVIPCLPILALSWLAGSITIAAKREEDIWITVSELGGSELMASKNVLSSQEADSEIIQGQFAIFHPSKSHLSKISEFMHNSHKDCGGLVAHDSLEEATHYIWEAEVADKNQIRYPYKIDNGQEVEKLKRQISPSNLLKTVNSLMRFNTRFHDSSDGIAASKWIKNHWESIAQGRNDITVKSHRHSKSPQPSVILTINGSGEDDEIVVIGAHLDSINSKQRSTPHKRRRAPGADDNASGVAVVTEALRAIVKAGYKPKKTIKIMAFSDEEQGLRGSKDIAGDYSRRKNVVGMVNFDMTGYKGSVRDIYLIADYTNKAQNDFLKKLIVKYLPDLSYDDMKCGYACSDHASWHIKRIPASAPAQSKFHESNPKIHSTRDTVVDQVHMSKFAKLAVAYLAELAKSATKTVRPPTSDTQLKNGVAQTGLRGNAKDQLFYTIDVPANSRNLLFTTSGGTGDADLYVKFGSKPTLESYDCKSELHDNDEKCDIARAQSGVYHVMVLAHSRFSNAKLTGSYEGISIS